MELIVISESKLKIMLTSEDLLEYSLDCNSLNYENTETRRAFWSILDEAKHRTGFDAASEKVFVQVYPSKKGGCEMYVTKLGIFSSRQRDEEDIYGENIRIKEDGRGASMKKCVQNDSSLHQGQIAPEQNFGAAYRFRKIEDMLSACRGLSFKAFSGNSSAYKCAENYYLLLKNIKNQYPFDDVGDFIKEYGESVDADSLAIYIGEHGYCICESSAVETLGALSS